MNKYKRQTDYLSPRRYKPIDKLYQTIKLKVLTMKANRLEKKLWKVKRFIKVIEWGEYTPSPGLFFGILFLILGVGFSLWDNSLGNMNGYIIILGISLLLMELISWVISSREVYWEEEK